MKFITVLALATTHVFAADVPVTPSQAAVETDQKTFFETLKEKSRLSYSGQFEGPSFGGATNASGAHDYGYVPSSNGSLGTKVYALHALTYGYQANSFVRLYGSFRSNSEFTVAPTFTVLNPRFGAVMPSIAKYGDLNFGMVAFIEPGFSSASRAAGQDLIAAFRVNPNLNYAIAKTGFSLGLKTFVQTYARGAAATNAKDLAVYAGPSLNYQILDNLSASVTYEGSAIHKAGTSLDTFASDGTDLQPSLSWDITKNVNFSPYLNLYVGDTVSWDSTYFGFYLSARFF